MGYRSYINQCHSHDRLILHCHHCLISLISLAVRPWGPRQDLLCLCTTLSHQLHLSALLHPLQSCFRSEVAIKGALWYSKAEVLTQCDIKQCELFAMSLNSRGCGFLFPMSETVLMPPFLVPDV